MPYRKKHVKSKIHKIKPKISIFRKLWFWVALFLVIIVVSVIYLAFFYSGFQLKNVLVSGNDKVKTQDIQGLVFRDSNTKIFDFLNIKIFSSSIFLINRAKISSDILSNFPVIGRADISKKMPQTVVLNIVERKPLGAFCSNKENDPSVVGCFLIDQDGVIFEPLPTDTVGTTIIRQVGEASGISVGQEVVSQSIIKAISSIQETMKDNFQISLSNVLISSSSRINVTTDQGWQIYFGLGSGPDISSQLMKLGSLLGGGISADNMQNLRYIDLRPKDRAIVCDNSTCGNY